MSLPATDFALLLLTDRPMQPPSTMNEITDEQLNAALLARLAQLNTVSDWGYITITVSGDLACPNLDFRASTRNTELGGQKTTLSEAIAVELAKHGTPESRREEADNIRKRAEELLERAAALEAEALTAP